MIVLICLDLGKHLLEQELALIGQSELSRYVDSLFLLRPNEQIKYAVEKFKETFSINGLPTKEEIG